MNDNGGTVDPAEEYRLAKLFFEIRDYGEAARRQSRVVEAEPDNLAARLLLARAYYHSARLGRAETELRFIVERDPTDAYAHLMLGRALERQNRPEEARRHLRLSAALRGEPIDAPGPRAGGGSSGPAGAPDDGDATASTR
ncbi:tetratricopeptide repeat protein [Streptomyces alkaliphilus]|uniref:tetratricopeptide repeat protein n=1 Tax=Streptomyces alkaliphilus TaxID=1472722 RepID=UPI00117EB89A|nr:tetratricopeptide repeat protein [Streptomyces alkaliphilus]